MKTKILIFMAILISQNSFAQHADHMKMMKNLANQDARKPVPLNATMAQHQLQNMREHLIAVQEIIAAMSERNFAGMKKAAQKLSSSPQMNMMCEHMGQGAPGYTEMGLALHKAADQLLVHADNKNYDAFVKQLNVTVKTCTSCHAQFKQQIIP